MIPVATMTAADLSARADRVKAICESVGGKVLKRNRDALRIEVPADIAPGLATLWGQGGFIPIYREQQFRSGIESRAFYIYDVGLQPPSQATAQPPPPPASRPRGHSEDNCP